MLEDTICAPATPPVPSTIAIIRMSGPGTMRTAQKIFSRPSAISPRQAVYGSVFDGSEIIDDVIVIFFASPYSYTGEDMLEIFCHGNQLIVRKIISLILSLDVRMAEPGEFTKRAFLNGKMDLTEAEAVNQIISARSDWEIAASLNQMHGSMKKEIESVRQKLILIRADIEATIDFSEEQIEFISRDAAAERIEEIKKDIEGLLLRCRTGEKLVHGIDITITGKPNAGKSSLLNLMLNQNRAIVSSIPGTTRDIIRETLQIAGIHVNLIDTAGLAEPADELEQIGMKLSEKQIASSSLILMVIDALSGIDKADLDIIEKLKDKRKIFIINKIDLVSFHRIQEIQKILPADTILLSASTGTGLESLISEIELLLKSEFFGCENSFIADTRIINLLATAINIADNLICIIKEGEPEEIIAFEVQFLLNCLSDITGEITPDEILNSLFSRFCIGK